MADADSNKSELSTIVEDINCLISRMVGISPIVRTISDNVDAPEANALEAVASLADYLASDFELIIARLSKIAEAEVHHG